MFLDDSACNLSSLQPDEVRYPAAQFDVEAYRYAVDVMITAQEILVDNSGYPTETIARNSHDYRPLGLGYANLGALLMAIGLPYDSDAGRDFAACVTAIMCGEAYLQSARIAELCQPLGPPPRSPQRADIAGGACPGFYVNREPFLDVIRMHRACGQQHRSTSTHRCSPARRSSTPLIEATACWDEALAHGERHGYRNSQVTVLAPTGTIGFMMDCDTTGIEPDLALVKYKKLVGGGMIKIVNNTVPAALFKLGYTADRGQRHRQLHRRHRHHRRRAAHQGRASCRLRLLLQARQGHALHPLHGPPQDDGRRPALHLRSHLQDHQHARERHRRRHRRRLHRSLEARASRP